MPASRRPTVLVACALAATGLAACSSGSPGAVSSRGSAHSSSGATGGDSSAPASSGARSGSPGTGGATGSSSAGSGAHGTSCADRTYARLSPAQRIGQLMMVGVEGPGGIAAVSAQISGRHVGNVLYLGGWTGSSTVASTSSRLQSEADSAATGGVPLLVAADQEGGAVQQLRGAGFTSSASALQQGRLDPAARTAAARRIGSELKSAGVNLDLAPVADTVPAATARANAPIGRFGREYGHDPKQVAAAVTDVVKGLQSAGTGATLKHFPGLGRVTGNTDVTASGTTDTTTTAGDDYLTPFRSGMSAGASAVMVSSAKYARLDSANQAPFSSAIISGLLRGKLGWKGVVVTDDMSAVAVSGIPAGERAVRFVAAGGDIVLTGRAGDAASMVDALTSRADRDTAFAGKVRSAVQRVLQLKARQGLLTCRG